jgi:hypothetical protein
MTGAHVAPRQHALMRGVPVDQARRQRREIG